MAKTKAKRHRDDAQKVANASDRLNTDQVRLLRCCGRRSGTLMVQIKWECLGLELHKKYPGKFLAGVHELESRGMLRVEKPQDSRAYVYFITDKGREALRNAEIAAGVFRDGNSNSRGTSSKVPANANKQAAEQRAAVDAAEQEFDRSQGFRVDAKLRKALEVYAMDAATEHFDSQNYAVDPEAHKNCPYDLECTRNGEVRYVEVKGTQTKGERIFLTAGEVDFAQRHKNEMVLFILHSINVSKDKKRLSGGIQKIVDPWDVEEGDKTAISYRYAVP